MSGSAGKIVVLGIAAYLLFRVAKQVNDVRLLDYEITGIGLQPGGGYVKLAIINPTSSSYIINNIVADIEDNGSRLALINYAGQLSILPGATTQVTLPVHVDPVGSVIDLLQTGAQLLFDKNHTTQDPANKHQLTISGTINSQGFVIPFSENIAAFTAAMP